MTDKAAKSVSTHTIRRIARIWSAVIIALATLVFIAEIIEATTTELEPYPFIENLIPFTLVLSVVGLVVAFRREGLGGAINILSVLVNLATYWGIGGRGRGLAVVFVILTPIAIPGILFLVCWLRTREDVKSLRESL